MSLLPFWYPRALATSFLMNQISFMLYTCLSDIALFINGIETAKAYRLSCCNHYLCRDYHFIAFLIFRISFIFEMNDMLGLHFTSSISSSLIRGRCFENSRTAFIISAVDTIVRPFWKGVFCFWSQFRGH